MFKHAHIPVVKLAGPFDIAPMLTVPMNLPHNYPGGSIEQLAPPRARSTSPLQKLRDWQYRGRTQPTSGAIHETRTDHERSASYGDPVSKTDQHMTPAPLRSATGKSASSKPRPSSSYHRRSRDGDFLQPNAHTSTRSPKLKHKISRPLPLELQETRPGEYILPATVYTEPTPEWPLRHNQQPSRHSFDPPLIAEPQPPSRDPLVKYRTTHDIAASASAPTTPRHPPPQWSSDSPPRPPSKTADFRKSTFATDDDFKLFAEALSGLGPEPSSGSIPGSLSAAPALDPGTLSSASLVSPITPEDHMSNYAPFPSRTLATSSTFPPSSALTPPRSTPSIRSQPSNDIVSSPSIETPQTAIQRDLALSGAMIGLNIEPSPREPQQPQHQLPREDVRMNDDDELPDYEQSQREAADAARMKALSRAAELESRWAASAPHRRR